MLKKITYAISIASFLLVVLSFKGTFRSAQPPTNVSGAPGGGLCTNCHTSFAVNSGGGNVSVSGLPSTFQPGQTYLFDVTISHGTADRTRWGFEINARNSNNLGIGTFSAGSNANATLISGPSEMGHKNAVFTAAASSYTYSGLSWTAPATINAGDNQVTFYVAGNAANGNGNNLGDYIYSNTALSVLPITLKDVNCKIVDEVKVLIQWQTSSETNSKDFVIEKSDDNANFYPVGDVPAAGRSSAERSYSYTDAKPSFFNQAVYYRLKCVDLDGHFKFSKTLTLTLSAKGLRLYALSPNPVKDHMIANIVADKAAQADLSIVSANGVRLRTQTIFLEKGNNEVRFATALLPHGLYYLCFVSKAISQSIAFIVE